MQFVSLRATSVALIAAGMLFVPAIASAAPLPNTGTLTGTVTCGADEAVPAAHILIGIPSLDLTTVTDDNGSFVLTGVPSLQSLNLVASADPEHSVVTGRPNVSVQAGATLNVGSMDLAVCGQPITPPAPNPWDTERSSVGSDY